MFQGPALVTAVTSRLPETSSSARQLEAGLFTAAFLIIAAVAMIGWSIALGWAAIRLGSMDVFLII